jgi:hypothetical protein
MDGSRAQGLGEDSNWLPAFPGVERCADRALHAEAADGLFQPALEACRLILSYTRYALYTPTHVDARTNASDLRGPAGGGEYRLLEGGGRAERPLVTKP